MGDGAARRRRTHQIGIRRRSAPMRSAAGSKGAIPMNRFVAGVLFLRPDDVAPAVETLAAHGCDFEIDHEMIDPEGPTVFGTIAGTTELGLAGLGDWLIEIVRPLGGDVSTWGYSEPVRD